MALSRRCRLSHLSRAVERFPNDPQVYGALGRVWLEAAERCAAVPVGYLEIDTDARQVATPALMREDVLLLPEYEPPLTRADENRVHATLEARLSGDRLFERPDFRTG